MTLHRFFAEGPLPQGAGPLQLSVRDTHHLRAVLRLAPGDEIAVVYGGRAARVRLTDVTEEVTGEVLGELPVADVQRVTLVQGLAKGEKMDNIIRHATELGVRRFVPLAAERSVVRLDAAKARARVERWRRIGTEAAKQSQQAVVPTVEPVAHPGDLPALLEGALVLVCWEDATDVQGIAAAIAGSDVAGREVALIVGPEGGLTSGEVDTLVRHGAITVTLGATVLRTETAAIVASALAIHALGGLGAANA